MIERAVKLEMHDLFLQQQQSPPPLYWVLHGCININVPNSRTQGKQHKIVSNKKKYSERRVITF